MPILATVRGLAIAASFFTAGSLATKTVITIPSILAIAEHQNTTAQTLAEQFEISWRMGKLMQPPAELFATVAFACLAWQSRSGMDTLTWKLYAGAAVSMFSVIPYTLILMEEDCKKIVSLRSTGRAKDQEPRLHHDGGLAVPVSKGPSITPVEEFEPYEDSPFSGAEYEKLKVKSLLQTWSSRNIFRVVATALAGALALNAITPRVALVTIIQGR